MKTNEHECLIIYRVIWNQLLWDIKGPALIVARKDKEQALRDAMKTAKEKKLIEVDLTGDTTFSVRLSPVFEKVVGSLFWNRYWSRQETIEQIKKVVENFIKINFYDIDKGSARNHYEDN